MLEFRMAEFLPVARLLGKGKNITRCKGGLPHLLLDWDLMKGSERYNETNITTLVSYAVISVSHHTACQVLERAFGAQMVRAGCPGMRQETLCRSYPQHVL